MCNRGSHTSCPPLGSEGPRCAHMCVSQQTRPHASPGQVSHPLPPLPPPPRGSGYNKHIAGRVLRNHLIKLPCFSQGRAQLEKEPGAKQMSCRAGAPSTDSWPLPTPPPPQYEPKSPENSLAKPLSQTWCYLGAGAPSDNTEHLPPPDSAGELHTCTFLG